MTAYLLKSHHHAVRYIASNLLTKSYLFYSMAWIPEGKDPVLTDAKILVKYDGHLSKEAAYRRRRAGIATVKYVRVGRLAILLATKGRSAFFDEEPWRDVREAPLHLAGYLLKVDRQTGKVSVRLHPEAQRRIRREWYATAKDDLREREGRIWDLDLLPFAGVRDNLFSLLKDLNHARKLLRKPPVDHRRCIRRRIAPGPVFLDSPPEILELLGWHRREARR